MTTEITSDDDAAEQAEDLCTEIDQLSGNIEYEDWQEALNQATSIRDSLTSLITYLEQKVKNSG